MLSVLLLLVSAAEPPTPPRNVYVGAYLSDVSDFDLKAGRFKADLRVWVKWLGDDTVPDVTFENGEVESKEELGREHDAAWHSVQWRVQGTFRGDFPVNAFPFDRQTLPVVFGLASSDGVLVPDLGASGIIPSFSITGWAYDPEFSARAEERVYRSDLGSVSDEGKDSHQRRAVFSVEMRRPFAKASRAPTGARPIRCGGTSRTGARAEAHRRVSSSIRSFDIWSADCSIFRFARNAAAAEMRSTVASTIASVFERLTRSGVNSAAAISAARSSRASADRRPPNALEVAEMFTFKECPVPSSFATG